MRPSKRRPGAAADQAKLPGSSRIARDFFAGRYAQIAARTFDVAQGRFAEEDVAFAVGALTFLGRPDDAEACFDAWRLRVASHDARTLAASRFFLGLAQARAGQFGRAHERLVSGVRQHLREGDAWSQAFVFQGLAAYRYFTGRYDAAARHALRALRAAHAAGFAYVKLLANDLRGHALIQIGRFSAGKALLEQARRLAAELGLELNAFAIDCSIATYSLKFGFEPELLSRLEALLLHPAHDSYSRHALLTEYAAQLALRGRATEARQALSQADREALQRDVRRAKISNLLAHLHVARWSSGPSECLRLLQESEGLVERTDVAFRAELLGFEACVSRARADRPRLEGALAGLRTLAASHELQAAKSALQQFSGEEYRAPAFAEDRRTPLLCAVARRQESSLARLLAAGFTGAVPELLGCEPGRRIWVLVAEDALLLENYGDLVLKHHPPGWCPLLLSLLASGDVSKEMLVARLWGLKLYRSERHDPLIRTTIHRLRAFIEPYGAWVRVTPSGYGTGVPVQLVGGVMPTQAEAELDDFGPEAEPAARRVETTEPPAARRVSERICRALSASDASVRQLAKASGVSQSTALRTLRELLAEGRVRRAGFARATRYRLVLQDE